MYPAISIIAFSTLSGAGFGLMIWLGLGFGSDEQLSAWVSLIIAGGLAAGGLISSIFHLARPDRAWRAFSQFKSSWLSREGVMALATFAVFGIYGLTWLLTENRPVGLGLLMSLLAFTTVFTTAMIYTQLRTVVHWHTPLTPLVFISFSISSGGITLIAIQTILAGGQLELRTLVYGLIPLIFAGVVKAIWWQRAAHTQFETPGTATGLEHLGKVHLLDRPSGAPTWLTKELVFVVARRRATALRRICLAFGIVAPLVLGLLAWNSPSLLLTAILVFFSLVMHLIGIFAERWLFFAEAEHVVATYY